MAGSGRKRACLSAEAGLITQTGAFCGYHRQTETDLRSRERTAVRIRHHQLAYHGNWYALALNTAKAGVETFALSRFRRIAATGHAFTRPAEFSPEAYARQAFGIVGGEKPIKVRLLFEPKLAVYNEQ